MDFTYIEIGAELEPFDALSEFDSERLRHQLEGIKLANLVLHIVAHSSKATSPNWRGVSMALRERARRGHVSMITIILDLQSRA